MGSKLKELDIDTGRPPCTWLTAQKASTLRTKEPATAPSATRCTLPRPSLRPNTPQMNAPSSGSAMIIHSDGARVPGGTGAVMKKLRIASMRGLWGSGAKGTEGAAVDR
jgi:hypothetical protein